MENIRILYAEDNDLVRDMTAQIVRHYLPNATLTVVENSDDFLTQARSGKYTVLFSDNDVPQSNSGLDSILQLRMEGDFTNAIIYTGGEGYEPMRTDPDCALFKITPLSKPFAPAQLIGLLKELGGCNDKAA